MAVVYKRLIDGSMLTVDQEVYYTAPPGVTGVIKQMTFCNSSDDAVNLTVFLGPAGAQHLIVDSRSIEAHATFICYEALLHVLPPGGTIEALASVPDAINVIASGCEVG